MSEENPVLIEPVDQRPLPVAAPEDAATNVRPIGSDTPVQSRPPEASEAAPGNIPDKEPELAEGSTPKTAASVDSSPSPEEEKPNADEDGTVSLNLAILDFAGERISGLKYRIIVGKEAYNGTTCSKGNATQISGLEPYQPIEILVRKASGEFVSKYKGYTECADMNMCAVSPHIKVALQTDLHEGEPGPATEMPSASAPVAPATATPVAPPEVKAPPAPPVIAPVAPPAGQIAGGGKPASKEPTSCRNEAGHPHASLKERTADWAKRHQIPTFGLWSWDDFKSGATGCTKPAVGPAAAPSPPGRPTPSTAAPQPPKAALSAPPNVRSATQAPPDEIKKLVDIMEEQTTWQWKQMFETDKYTSAGIKVAILNKTFTPRLGKEVTIFNGRCYPAVKIGLWRSGLVTGYGDDIPAKGAGKWLLAQGFKDVTSTVPDARWALPGDIVVYRYPDEVEEKNRKAVETAQKKYTADKAAYDLQKAAFAQDMSKWEAEVTRHAQDRAEAKRNKKKYDGGVEPKKPKLGPEPRPPNDANYGHIDVRTYDAYISDAKQSRLPDASRFVTTGIFRKVADALPDLRLRAFLKVIREFECHEEADDAKRYFMTATPINGVRRFTDVATHPFEFEANKQGTPAGAYQIIFKTYKGFTASRWGIGTGFSPLQQDRIAVALLENSPQGNALALIRKGEIAKAVSCLTLTWSSLPGGSQTRKEKRGGSYYTYTMNDLIARYESFLNEQISH